MIRKITRNNDYKDIIKSCPSGVIDDIYRIDYFVSGQPGVYIETTPEKVGNHLEVILSTALLKSLTYNGILMRRAYYKKADPSYPDGYYNLEFVDNMEVWLGEEETSPFDPEGYYLTADDLKTINYQSIVGEGNIETVEYDSEIALGNSEYIGYVDVLKRPIDEETFETRTLILGYVPTGETTWDVAEVRGSQLGENSYELVSDELLETGFTHYATESWVGDQGYLTEVPSEYATESWVSSNFLSTTALSGYATESWVQSQGYLTSVPSGYATESWVQSQGYLTSVPSGYATESWVQSQGYLTSVPSEYATQSWVSSQFLETSKIWTGTSSQWEELTPEQQAFYTIALVTE